MRIGINGNKLVATGDVQVIADHASGVAAAGLDAYWLAQHPAGALDAITTLGVLGRELPPIDVGTGVVPIWGRHPAALAASVLTAAQRVPGPFTVGIGLSHPAMVAEHLGALYHRPVRTMREYLQVLVPLLTTGAADLDGEIYTCHTTVPLIGERRPSVLVAAMGSQMLQLAGELADGTITSWTGPRTLRDHVVPTIRAAAAAAGRPAPRIASVFQVCVTDDAARAREAVHQWFLFHGKAPSYEAMLEREGASTAADVAIIGDEASVRARLEELAEIGVTDLAAGEVTVPGDDDPLRTRRLLASLASSHLPRARPGPDADARSAGATGPA
jgi:F420-dependent oxidoreductase-like protein